METFFVTRRSLLYWNGHFRRASVYELLQGTGTFFLIPLFFGSHQQCSGVTPVSSRINPGSSQGTILDARGQTPVATCKANSIILTLEHESLKHVFWLGMKFFRGSAGNMHHPRYTEAGEYFSEPNTIDKILVNYIHSLLKKRFSGESGCMSFMLTALELASSITRTLPVAPALLTMRGSWETLR